jgi:LytS/YehU family sensor histidine kinase
VIPLLGKDQVVAILKVYSADASALSGEDRYLYASALNVIQVQTQENDQLQKLVTQLRMIVKRYQHKEVERK